MGQIVGLNAKCKRANLNALGSVPTPATGEHILVSSDNSMNAAGQGNFDCYIVGDGSSAATALEMKPIENLAADASSKIGYAKGIINVVAATAHSAKADRFKVFIPAGTSFDLTFSNLTGAAKGCSVYACYGEQTNPVNIGVLYKSKKTFTAANDITSLGVYISTPDATTTGTMQLLAEWGITKTINGINTSVSTLNTKVNTINSNIASINTEIDGIKDQLYSAANYHISLGSLYKGNVNYNPNTTYMCLSSDVFVPVEPNEAIRVVHASGVTIRIAEYSGDSASTFIKDSGTYAAMDSYTVGATTKYVRISGYYTGYTAENPISVNDFNEGDFGIELPIANVIDSIIENSNQDNILTRNREKLCRIKAASKTAWASQKNYVFVIATDIHGNTQCLENAIDLADGISEVDSVFILGDQLVTNYSAAEVATIQQAYAHGTKPKFMILGNHDVGNTAKVRFSCDHAQAYNAFIKPVVDAGFLASGEYESGKSYYYHDVATQKIRFIFLNDFDEIIEFADSDYWEAVTYDSSAPLMANSTSYSVGDVVNCGACTSHSFRCKANCTSGTSSRTDGQEPRYKMERGFRAIQQTQAQWFLNTLASTPADYSVIVATHVLFSKNSTALVSAKFCQNIHVYASTTQDLMSTDFIADAVNAFINGSNYSANIVFSGDAQYMNTEGGNIPAGGGSYAYSVSKNFATKASGVKFIGFVGGHFHQDIIWQHNTHTSLKSVTPMSSNPNAYATERADIKRSSVVSDVEFDALTSVGVDTTNEKFALARIGADVSTDMYLRDVEKI